MYLFQVISFIVEVTFLLGIALILILNSDDFLEKWLESRVGTPKKNFNNYIFDDSKYSYQKTKGELGVKIANKIVAYGFAAFFIYFAIPYVKDIPQLVTGNIEYTKWRVYSVEKRDKDLYHRINVNGREIKFFFEGNLIEGKNYKIGYLTNSKRGIYLELLDDDMKTPIKKIGFPFKSILFYIAFFICLIGMLILSYKIGEVYRYKIFLIVSLLFYPISIAYFVYYGFNTGELISPNNVGFAALIAGGVCLLFFIPSKMLVTWNRWDEEGLLIFAQFIAVLEIGFIIAIMYNLYIMLVK
ncbi:hypothetical protein [Clostridium grantii]|uniref:Uncharacterized protein n=1 Tax=Clostridium grantii DSM 8605 TaxID=1121316 RepID=A0A1M5WXT9_9CLOT|nr:hypothetical protein [Clostridium grantii]SHH92320.1 hypothetical protein SAMN02745207_03201 [Clostridium grantii DSM 8605]